jgi:hypothetical protein
VTLAPKLVVFKTSAMETQTQRSNSVKRLLSKNLRGVDSQFLQFLDAGKSAAEKNLWFFEIAWEVANQGKFMKWLMSLSYYALYLPENSRKNCFSQLLRL